MIYFLISQKHPQYSEVINSAAAVDGKAVSVVEGPGTNLVKTRGDSSWFNSLPCQSALELMEHSERLRWYNINIEEKEDANI